MCCLPTCQVEKKQPEVHWCCTCGSQSPFSWSSPDANSREPHSPCKPPKYGDAGVESCFMYPMLYAVPSIVMMAAPVVCALHPVLAYFVFNWDVRAAQLPDSLPRNARDEPAFPSLPFPTPVTIWFETPLGLSPCVIDPIVQHGKPVPINVGRVLACISRELYKPVHSTALSAGRVSLPAVHQAAAGRPYDPEPNRKERVARTVDLYPVPCSRHHHAPLFFWGIELQHGGGGAVRLVARFGHKALKA